MTPGPWKWWTSNSWRRLKRDDRGITQNVLEPYVCRDGHPDLTVSEEDMGLIAAAPDMFMALLDLQVIAEQHITDLAAEAQEGGPIARMEMARWKAVISAFSKAQTPVQR